jgi:hypothetical protein
VPSPWPTLAMVRVKLTAPARGSGDEEPPRLRAQSAEMMTRKNRHAGTATLRTGVLSGQLMAHPREVVSRFLLKSK